MIMLQTVIWHMKSTFFYTGVYGGEEAKIMNYALQSMLYGFKLQVVEKCLYQ